MEDGVRGGEKEKNVCGEYRCVGEKGASFRDWYMYTSLTERYEVYIVHVHVSQHAFKYSIINIQVLTLNDAVFA